LQFLLFQPYFGMASEMASSRHFHFAPILFLAFSCELCGPTPATIRFSRVIGSTRGQENNEALGHNESIRDTCKFDDTYEGYWGMGRGGGVIVFDDRNSILQFLRKHERSFLSLFFFLFFFFFSFFSN
jgi:hypothetical protein